MRYNCCNPFYSHQLSFSFFCFVHGRCWNVSDDDNVYLPRFHAISSNHMPLCHPILVSYQASNKLPHCLLWAVPSCTDVVSSSRGRRFFATYE